MQKGAIMSDCENYRYQLWRIWDDSKPKLMFIMLNPSTADAQENDPTINRCTSFAQNWGYGGLYVGNIFAYRSTNPAVLKQVTNPLGDDNYFHLLQMRKKCEIIVAAWGNNGPKLENLSLPEIETTELYCIDWTKLDRPKHPLYIKSGIVGPTPVCKYFKV
ncbi:DUF1643 domain-containing protein [Haliscomenobacter hydrossis]|uniref:DUF1643 domain-containing protein n=1 Tax=Haliscomenobacter hydrossis (strain ATCC 27775 / DSM 1100 / LMG 10767 / O) TaxID=760192 RepID=F4KU39_HALH1|nr:DUF1643 domain-containing protein [Haliscomenobacter hydrossis]AEE50136.1 protein of unknown function DUF1643 [Haliscomenobacter hydrossis DSM 1100]